MANPSDSAAEDLLHNWNSCHGAFYQLNSEDLKWNLHEQRLLDYTTEMLGDVPVLWARPAAEGVALGIPQGGLWVSVYGKVQVGGEGQFAAMVERVAKAKGAKRVAIASDEFHFLPGIPVDEPAGVTLVEEFRKLGFSSADCADLVGNPGNPLSAKYVSDAMDDSRARNWTLRLVEAADDSRELSEFLQREFSGRWLREWKVWNQRADSSRAFWNLLRDETGKVLGFSRLAKRDRFVPLNLGWTPGAMRLPLRAAGERRDTDSCLGPIGISAAERGRGAGKILLGLSIHELSLQRAELTCIDWTNAYNYYTPLGFEIVRRYQTVWKEL